MRVSASMDVTFEDNTFSGIAGGGLVIDTSTGIAISGNTFTDVGYFYASDSKRS